MNFVLEFLQIPPVYNLLREAHPLKTSLPMENSSVEKPPSRKFAPTQECMHASQ